VRPNGEVINVSYSLSTIRNPPIRTRPIAGVQARLAVARRASMRANPLQAPKTRDLRLRRSSQLGSLITGGGHVIAQNSRCSEQHDAPCGDRRRDPGLGIAANTLAFVTHDECAERGELDVFASN